MSITQKVFFFGIKTGDCSGFLLLFRSLVFVWIVGLTPEIHGKENFSFSPRTSLHIRQVRPNPLQITLRPYRRIRSLVSSTVSNNPVTVSPSPQFSLSDRDLFLSF